MLAFEHVWHGEVVPWFPFLTAASNPADASVMLHEMSTIGVTMAVLVTAVWAAMVLVSGAMARKTLQPAIAAKSGEFHHDLARNGIRRDYLHDSLVSESAERRYEAQCPLLHVLGRIHHVAGRRCL